MKLIRVKRSNQGVPFGWEYAQRTLPEAIKTTAFDTGPGAAPVEEVGEFFVVGDDRDLSTVVAQLAKRNPGKEVQVFDLKEVYEVQPQTEVIKKEVTPNGILPSFGQPNRAAEVQADRARPLFR